MTIRTEKVASLIQRELSEILRTEGFEGITGLLTITGVEVSADLEHAKIFFSVVGSQAAEQSTPSDTPPGEAEEEALKILNNHIYEIQGAINRKLVMKKLPRIHFVPDASGEYADRIGKIIKKLHEDDGSE